MPDLSNAVLFLEGYHSYIIQWNSMLEQYNQMGAFNKAVVFGYIYQLQYEESNKYDIVKVFHPNKKELYTNEAKQYFENNVSVPIDMEEIIL